VTGDTATCDRIVETALALFRHYGHAKTTLSDIAKACGMSRANVYRFFTSKSAIAEAICDRLLDALAGDLGRIAAGPSSASSRLVAMADRVARFNRDGERSDERIHALLVSAVEEDSIVVRRFVHQTRTLFATVVGDGMAAGEFAEGDPARIARCLCFSLIGFWHPSVTDRCSALTDAHDVPELVDFLLSGLRSGRNATGVT